MSIQEQEAPTISQQCNSGAGGVRVSNSSSNTNN